ncbi:hypothetical protein [Shewanella sp. 10N.286.48.B5]|uniref:hypothetical protein n=1 Tax=Shewanella sp. 10N.286.48.B5 TaxID=1880834 RepID=UPI0039A53EEC
MNSVNSQRQAKLYRYQLPMDSGVILRDNKVERKIGYIIQLECDGKSGFGEVAHRYQALAKKMPNKLASSFSTGLELWSHNNPQTSFDELYPSVAFGLSSSDDGVTR